MTVKELRDILVEASPDAKIVMSTDEEGNAYNFLDVIEESPSGNVILYPETNLKELSEV